MRSPHDGTRRPGSRAARVAIYLAIWTAVGLFFATQVYLDFQYAGEPIGWGAAIVVALVDWYLWAALFPLILTLSRRWPLARPGLLRAVAVHLPATLVIAIAKGAVEQGIVRASHIVPETPVTMTKLNASLLTCWLIVGVAHALVYYRTSVDRKERALRLEAELSGARLQLLKTQLQPHFLFNTLHAIGTLMHRDVAAAESMLTRLADLLRLSLEQGDEPEIPLGKEIELTRLYLDIQQQRFGDRLRVSYDVDPQTLDARVPSMILQPIVENAILHGVAQRTGAGRLSVSARRDGDRLELVVEDDGPGLDPDASEVRDGVGLANTRARLRELYGARHALRLERREGGGLRVAVELPFGVGEAAER